MSSRCFFCCLPCLSSTPLISAQLWWTVPGIWNWAGAVSGIGLAEQDGKWRGIYTQGGNPQLSPCLLGRQLWGVFLRQFQESFWRDWGPFPSVIITSLKHHLLGFLPVLCHFCLSLISASRYHLEVKLLALSFLFQSLLLKELKLRYHGRLYEWKEGRKERREEWREDKRKREREKDRKEVWWCNERREGCWRWMNDPLFDEGRSGWTTTCFDERRPCHLSIHLWWKSIASYVCSTLLAWLIILEILSLWIMWMWLIIIVTLEGTLPFARDFIYIMSFNFHKSLLT